MMDPSEHLRMVKRAAAGGSPRQAELNRVRALRFKEPGFDHDRWRKMCQKGWLGLRIAKDRGGAGRNSRAFCNIAEELGADLAPEPLIAAAMAVALLPDAHLAPVLAGERIVLPAWQERLNSLDPFGDTTLRNGRLRGRKTLIPMATGADTFVVSTADGLALVRRDAPGVSLEVVRSQDGGHFGTLILDDAPGEAIPGDPAEALEHAIVAHSAYLFGLTQRVFALALGPSQKADDIREELRQSVEDMKLQISLTRSVVREAVASVDTAATLAGRQAAVSRGKMRAVDAALMVTRACRQLRVLSRDAGDFALYWEKATVLAPLYGPPSVHRARLGAGA